MEIIGGKRKRDHRLSSQRDVRKRTVALCQVSEHRLLLLLPQNLITVSQVSDLLLLSCIQRHLLLPYSSTIKPIISGSVWILSHSGVCEAVQPALTTAPSTRESLLLPSSSCSITPSHLHLWPPAELSWDEKTGASLPSLTVLRRRSGRSALTSIRSSSKSFERKGAKAL